MKPHDNRPPWLALERHHHPLLPFPAFLRRLLACLGVSMGLILLSLFAGMLGYRHFEGMSWLDAFLNASMIMSGMGPAQELHTAGGKLFAGCYALYAGLTLITAVAFLAAPLLHRLLHHFHLEEGSDGN
jgi:hypothetical protein